MCHVFCFVESKYHCPKCTRVYKDPYYLRNHLEFEHSSASSIFLIAVKPFATVAKGAYLVVGRKGGRGTHLKNGRVFLDPSLQQVCTSVVRSRDSAVQRAEYFRDFCKSYPACVNVRESLEVSPVKCDMSPSLSIFFSLCLCPSFFLFSLHRGYGRLREHELKK